MNSKKNKFNREQVRDVARKYGYKEAAVKQQDVNHKMSFKKDRVKGCGGAKDEFGAARVDVFFTSGAVTTYLDHPKVGKGQMYRYQN